MKLIPLTQGKFAKVDDDDYEWLSKFNWHYRKSGYAFRYVSTGTCYRMHREILGIVDLSIEIDHRNSDKLDNQRHNLRTCNSVQNNMNRSVIKGICGFKGVSLSKNHKQKPFHSQIRLDGKVTSLGFFESGIEAARAYDKAANDLFGEFARLNFPDEIELKNPYSNYQAAFLRDLRVDTNPDCPRCKTPTSYILSATENSISWLCFDWRCREVFCTQNKSSEIRELA